jgi:hypothetical protein
MSDSWLLRPNSKLGQLLEAFLLDNMMVFNWSTRWFSIGQHDGFQLVNEMVFDWTTWVIVGGVIPGHIRRSVSEWSFRADTDRDPTVSIDTEGFTLLQIGTYSVSSRLLSKLAWDKYYNLRWHRWGTQIGGQICVISFCSEAPRAVSESSGPTTRATLSLA